MDTIEIIFLVIDIILVILTFILSKALIKAHKEYERKSLLSIAFTPYLVAHPTLLTVLIIIAVILFLTVCELSFKIYQINHKEIVKAQKEIDVPEEIYHYEGQIVDGVEYHEHSYENDEILIDEPVVEEKEPEVEKSSIDAMTVEASEDESNL